MITHIDELYYGKSYDMELFGEARKKALEMKLPVLYSIRYAEQSDSTLIVQWSNGYALYSEKEVNRLIKSYNWKITQ
jgi:hypothetical protein